MRHARSVTCVRKWRRTIRARLARVRSTCFVPLRRPCRPRAEIPRVCHVQRDFVIPYRRPRLIISRNFYNLRNTFCWLCFFTHSVLYVFERYDRIDFSNDVTRVISIIDSLGVHFYGDLHNISDNYIYGVLWEDSVDENVGLRLFKVWGEDG